MSQPISEPTDPPVGVAHEQQTAERFELTAKLQDAERTIDELMRRNTLLQRQVAQLERAHPFEASMPANWNAGIAAQATLAAMQRVCNVSLGLLIPDFTVALKEAVERHWPNLRCSALRAIVCGKVSGRPIIKAESVYRSSILNNALCFADVIETMYADALNASGSLDKKGVPNAETLRGNP